MLFEFRNVTENCFSDRLTVGECTKSICDIKERIVSFLFLLTLILTFLCEEKRSLRINIYIPTYIRQHICWYQSICKTILLDNLSVLLSKECVVFSLPL